MASTIILKNGTGSAIPTTLAQGEPAINVDTGLFYYGSGSAGAVKTFSNFTDITASLSASLGGNISASGEVTAASGSFRKGINIGMLDNSIMRLYRAAVNQQHISASGKLIFNSSHFQFTNDAPVLGPSSFFRVVGDTNIIGNVTSSGNISASGVGTHILGGPLTLATSGDSVLKIMSNTTNKVEHELHGRGNVHSFLCSSSIMNLGIGNNNPTEKLTVSGSISASGNLILEGFISSSTYISTTHITASSNISASGFISASSFSGDGSGLSNVPATNATNVVTTLNEEEHEDDFISFVDGTSGNQGVEVSRNLVYNPAKQSFQVLGTSGNGHITASGNISASGNVIAAEITASGAIKVEHLHSTDDAQIDDDLTVSGDINANGNIVGDGATQLSGLTHITAIGNMAFGNHGSDSHTITGTTSHVGPITINGHISSSGDISGSNVDAGGNISAVGHITSSGRIQTLSHITASGNISSSGYLYGLRAIADRIQHNNGVSDIYFANGIHVAGGTHITASGNISSSGTISGSKIHSAADTSATFFNARTKTTGYKLGGVKVLYKSGSGDVIVGQTTNKTIITGSSVVLGNNVLSHVTASGNISSSGNITAANVRLPGAGKISFDDSLDGTDQFIKGVDNNILIDGDDYVKIAIDKEFYVGTTSTLANFKVDTAGNITSSGNIVITGSISSSRLLVTSASFGTSTIAPSSSVTIEGRLSSSGDIETEGFVYSENPEVLVNGSWRAATLAVGDYAYPGNHGFMNTNWSVESGGGPPDYGNTQVGGMIIPYSCSLVGVRANINATVGGSNHSGSFTIWAEKMLQGMASTAHEPDLIFEMYMPTPEGQKNYQYSQLTGVTSSQAANYSVLTPGHILNIAYKNEAGSSHNVLGHYCILIKRIKELH